MKEQLPRRQLSIHDWYERGPSSKVSRKELLLVMEGFDFVPRDGIVAMFRDYDRIRIQMRWYRRLWRWLKLTIYHKKTLADLDPSAREAVRQELDKVDEELAAKVTEEKVEAPTLEEVKDGD